MPYPSFGVAPTHKRKYAKSARVRIELTAPLEQISFADYAASWILTEYTDDNVTWRPVRGTENGLQYNNSGKIVVYDYEAPPRRIRQYRAMTVVQLTNGDLLYSEPSSIGYAVLYLSSVWFKNVNNPQRNFTVPVDPKWLTVNDNQSKDVVLPAGATYPVIVSQPGKYVSFKLQFTGIGDAAWGELQLLRDSTETWLVQTPKDQWWVRVSDATERDEDMFSLAEETARLFRATFTEVDPI